MHRLLARQLRKAGVDPYAAVPGLSALMGQIEESYEAFDADRLLLERSLELSSQELLAASADVRASEEVLRRTLQATADGVLAVDNDGKVLHVNDRYFEILDLPRDLFHIQDTQTRLAIIADRLTDPHAFLNKMRAVLSGEISESYDILTLRSGRVVERSSRPLDVLNGASGRVWSYRDITDHHRLEEQLRHQAFHDSLTGLANRARFMDRVEHALERSIRSQSPVFVLFLDLDDFKAVNDTLGHAKGDETIKAVAQRIAHVLRPGDTASRLGGDEFGLLLEDTDLDEAQSVARGVLETIRGPLEVEGKEIFVDASIGIAASDSRSTPDSLLRNADIAMYVAKNRGRGRIELYQDGMHARLSERQALVAELRQGLLRDELAVHFQPVIFLSSGDLAGAEALVRWNHPSRGLIPPNDFIPIAEEFGMIGEIGEYVLHESLRLLREWQSDSRTEGLIVGVNVSARQLRSGFPETVRGAIEGFGIDPGGLILELTESAILDDPDAAMAILTELKELGVRLALDDFGTGYSSLSYLKRFPIDVLKIDKSFIADIDLSEQESLLAKATISFGKQLKLRVLAEGIEYEEQLGELLALDCEVGQGFLFSRPLPRGELDAFVASNLNRTHPKAA